MKNEGREESNFQEMGFFPSFFLSRDFKEGGKKMKIMQKFVKKMSGQLAKLLL